MRLSRTVLASAGAAAATATSPAVSGGSWGSRSSSSSSSSSSSASRARRVCLTCLSRLPVQQHRPFSHSVPRHAIADAPSAAPSGPSPAGLAELTSRKLISVSGPDAARYLQGVITANLTPGHGGANLSTEHIRTDAGFYAAFLTAQGRILHDVFIYRDPRDASHPPGHSWLIEVDAAEADRLQKHIKRYKLRAKFDIRVLDHGEARVWQAWDDDNSARLSPIISTLSSYSSSPTRPTIITAPDTRSPNLGHRILTFSPPPPSSSSSSPPHEITADGKLPVLPENAYTLRRYLHGVAEGQSELLHGQALPHESNLDLTGAVDFRKGCYVGQELTIRTEHRGVVRKRVLPCLLYPDHNEGDSTSSTSSNLPDTGVSSSSSSSSSDNFYSLYRPEIAPGLTAATVPVEASIGRVGRKGRSAGKWLRGIGNVGLALCRLETMTDIVLPGEATGPAFSEGDDEFVVSLAGEGGGGEAEEVGSGSGDGGTGTETTAGGAARVRIKALVPDWLRKGLADKEKH